MPLDLATGLLYGGSVLANGFMQQRAAAYNQEQVGKNTAQNYKYAMMAQQNAPVNEVYGLKAAGLSPTFANGAQGMAVSQGAAGTAQAPQIDPLATAMLRAQVDKTKAEADSIKIDNANKEGENSTLGKNMSMFYRKLAEDTTDEEWKKFYLSESDFAEKGDFTRGNYDALLKFFDLQGKPEEAIERKLDKKLSAYLAELRWNKAKGHTMDSSTFVKALGTLDVRQSDLLAEQASNLIAQGKQIGKDTELIGAKLSLTNEQIEQVKAAAAQLRDANVMEFINQGDYPRALLAMLLQLFGGISSHPPI